MPIMIMIMKSQSHHCIIVKGSLMIIQPLLVIYIYIRKKPLLDIHGVLLDANWIWIIDYSILWYTMYLRCQVVPLSVLWGWVIDRPMSLNFTGRLGYSKELGQRDGPKRRYNLLPKCSNGSMGLTWQNLLVLSREWMGMGEWDHYW